MRFARISAAGTRTVRNSDRASTPAPRNLAAIRLWFDPSVFRPPTILVAAGGLEIFMTPHPLAKNRKYGWIRSNQPSPHPLYCVPDEHFDLANLPTSVDLEPLCPLPYDQLQLGSCTANALAALWEFLRMKAEATPVVPSRLMIYYGERAIEGTISTDSGAIIDDGIDFLTHKGVAPEPLWPYDQAKFAINPPPSVWGAAWSQRLIDPVTIAPNDILAIKSRLAQGYPVAFGFVAYPELEGDKVAITGILDMPTPGEQPIGGHAVLIVGYNEATQEFKVRNSWGPKWGLAGYFLMPYAYTSNADLASDFRSASSAS
jgi:C1A family cysteine protease